MIMSLFTYMISVWGGKEGYIIKAAQVIQNRAARIVTKKGLFTSQKNLLSETNWLSIRQMITFHSILQIWRVRKSNRPEYLNDIFNPNYNQQTRMVRNGNIRIPDTETSLGKNALRIRGATWWNSLPPDLKMFSGDVLSFKRELKKWVKTNTEM